jgi:hypothetical protein
MSKKKEELSTDQTDRADGKRSHPLNPVNPLTTRGSIMAKACLTTYSSTALRDG